MRLITHDGAFHADEVFATVILEQVFNPVEVVRTRDLSIVEDGDIVYDVGMKYDGLKYFDHHQQDDTLVRDNGIPYSSFGLIWKHYGFDYIKGFGVKDVNKIKTIWQKMDRTLAQAIDADDNGFFISMPDEYPRFTTSMIVGNFNRKDKTSTHQKTAFFEAVDFADVIIRKQLELCIERVEDYSKVKALITDSPILELNETLRWGDAVKNSHIKYVIFPTDNGFKIRAVEPEYYFNIDDIEESEDVVFCHKVGFLAGVTTIEAAYEFIKKYGK